MAIRTREELMELINARIGDDNSDEAISFLEDVSDTLDDLERNSTGDSEEWKTKFEENDAKWRKKYTDRFFNSSKKGETKNEEEEEEEEEEEKPKTFEDLFKEE